jgi:hypothetical protein
MSKMDNLRAMREAKYAANAKRTASTRATAPRTAAPVAPVAPPAAAKSASPGPATTSDSLEASSDELCGHRNMSGRTCTRERGHAAKSHRYS